jgi:hypothetical protein
VSARDPATVWMVHKDTGRAGVRGELVLTEAALIFRPEIRGAKRDLDLLGETVLPLGEVRKASRNRGTPVLEVRTRTSGVPAVILFFFAKPPDMYSSGVMNPRTHSATYLANSNLIYRDEVESWVSAIRSAIGAPDSR